MRRRIVFVLAGAAVAAAIVYAGLWFVASGDLRDGIERWAVDRRAAGWLVAWENISIDGFPFSLSTQITMPRITGPHASWDWRGPTIFATSRPWNLNNPKIIFPGRHQISVTRDVASREFTLTAAEAVGRAEIRAGRLVHIAIKLTQIDFIAADGLKTTGDALSLSVAPNSPEPSLSIALAGVVMPDGPHAVLGRNIAALDAEFKLSGGAVLTPSSRLRLSAALGDWRDAGGTVDIKRLRLDWGGMKFDGDGTFALDADLQPVGAMKARIRGYRELVDGLVRARQMRERDADMAKFVLNMVARATPGGKNTVTVPVTIQDRRLFVGPASLMKLPRINWD